MQGTIDEININMKININKQINREVMMMLEPNQVQGTIKSNIVNRKININKQKREG